MSLVAARPRPSGRLLDAVRPEHLAAGRTAVGAVMVARPRTLPQVLGVDSATSARASWVVQMVGAREIALGVGTLVSLRRPDRRAARLWIAAGALSDAVDVLAIGSAVARGRLSRGTGGAVVLSALAAAVLGWRAVEESATES